MRSLVVCLPACFVSASPDKVIKESDFETDKAKPVKVKVIKDQLTVKKGEVFSVRLEANPSTGFS